MNLPLIQIQAPNIERYESGLYNYRHKRMDLLPSEYTLAVFLGLHCETNSDKTRLLTLNREFEEEYDNYSSIFAVMARNKHLYDCLYKTSNISVTRHSFKNGDLTIGKSKGSSSFCSFLGEIEAKNWIGKVLGDDNSIRQHQEQCKILRDSLKRREPEKNFRILVGNRDLLGAVRNFLKIIFLIFSRKI